MHPAERGYQQEHVSPKKLPCCSYENNVLISRQTLQRNGVLEGSLPPSKYDHDHNI